MDIAALKAKLSVIPHLKLADGIDHADLVAEIRSVVDEYVPIGINESLAGPTANEFASAWRARGLVDYLPDSRRPITYQLYRALGLGDGINVNHVETELLKELPLTRRLIFSLCNTPRVCRLMVLKANLSLPWHSHSGGKADSTRYLIYQIPLINSEACTYEVREDGSGDVFKQVYRVGEIWNFNSFHSHRVVNHSNEDRLTLFLEVDPSDPIVFERLNTAADRYLAQPGAIVIRPRGGIGASGEILGSMESRS